MVNVSSDQVSILPLDQGRTGDRQACWTRNDDMTPATYRLLEAALGVRNRCFFGIQIVPQPIQLLSILLDA